MVRGRQAAADHLGRDRHLQPVRVAGRRRAEADAHGVDGRVDVRGVLVPRRRARAVHGRPGRQRDQPCLRARARRQRRATSRRARRRRRSSSAGPATSSRSTSRPTSATRKPSTCIATPPKDYARTLVFQQHRGWSIGAVSPRRPLCSRWSSRTPAPTRTSISPTSARRRATPKLITPHKGDVPHDVYEFTRDSRQLVYSTDEHGEFNQAWTYDLASGERKPLIQADWDVLVRRVLGVRPLSRLGHQRGRAHGRAHPRQQTGKDVDAAGSAGRRPRAGPLLARRDASSRCCVSSRHFAERRLHGRSRRAAQRAADARAESGDQGSGPGRHRGRALPELRRAASPVDPVPPARRFGHAARCRRSSGCTAAPAGRAAAATPRRSSTWSTTATPCSPSTTAARAATARRSTTWTTASTATSTSRTSSTAKQLPRVARLGRRRARRHHRRQLRRLHGRRGARVRSPTRSTSASTSSA